MAVLKFSRMYFTFMNQRHGEYPSCLWYQSVHGIEFRSIESLKKSRFLSINSFSNISFWGVFVYNESRLQQYFHIAFQSNYSLFLETYRLQKWTSILLSTFKTFLNSIAGQLTYLFQQKISHKSAWISVAHIFTITSTWIMFSFY